MRDKLLNLEEGFSGPDEESPLIPEKQQKENSEINGTKSH